MDGTNSGGLLNSPAGLAINNAGVIYVADPNSVRRIAPVGTNWVLTTLAGSIQFHGTSDGTNFSAQFDYPQALTIDSGGALYVADTYNNAIRRVTSIGTNWVVTTIAGLTGRENNGYRNDTNTNARFFNPYGIASDTNTNLYVADTLNQVIRKITPLGTNWVVTKIAGFPSVGGSTDGTNEAARFNAPAGVAVGSDGSLYVADFTNNTIRKITAYGTNWVTSTFAGAPRISGSADGPGPNARFNQPLGIATDSSGHVYVADSGNNTIRRITPAGVVSTIAGAPGFFGTADDVGTAARLNLPSGIAVDASGAVYISDTLNATLRQGRVAYWLQLNIYGNQVVLSWPVAFTGCVALASSTLGSGSWTTSSAPIITLGEYFVQTNAYRPGGNFYRLLRHGP
jgi:sugar lactone lactonase YvrE